MKKSWIVVLVVGLLFVACGRGNDEPESIAEPEIEVGEEAVAPPEEAAVVSVERVLVPHDELTTMHFLYDIDHMLYVLENNFSLFDVAYWARGVNIYEIAENVRAAILVSPDMDVDDFFIVLRHYFSRMVDLSIGHFNIVTPQHYDAMLRGQGFESWLFPRDVFGRLSYPHVQGFYEPRRPIPMDDLDEMEVWINRVSSLPDEIIRRELLAFSSLSVYLGQEIVDENKIPALNAFLDGDYATVAQYFMRISELFQTVPNVFTEILEDGRVGYLAVRSFMIYPAPVWEQNKIFDFYEEIRDFDHLIIDLRVNTGGSSNYFANLIMGPNISENLIVEGFGFASYGTYSAEFLTTEPRPGFTTFLNPIRTVSVAGSIRNSIDEFLRNHDLPELNMADMERMDYGFQIQKHINAGRLSRFDNEPVFTGKVWLLTHSRMGSAAQISAWVARETGFATLVGDITGGVYGGYRTMAALPYSGIVFIMDTLYVTDAHGRPLEAGTIPHYFNREGLDALGTVLSMITEGLY